MGLISRSSLVYLTIVAILSLAAILHLSSRKHPIAAETFDQSSYAVKVIKPRSIESNFDSKIILLWTGRFEDRSWSKELGRNGGPLVEIPSKKSRTCYLTTDRNLVRTASGLIFHSWDIADADDVPRVRFAWQRWVFFMNEPPLRSGLRTEQDWQRAEAMNFNMTMSYVLTADVWFPYGHFYSHSIEATAAIKNKTTEKIEKFVGNFPLRPVDAVWIVSDCHSFSSREFLVDQLKDAGISVKIWGNCSGNFPDPEWRRIGRQNFFSNYRFYFAFENSLCEDYISEKAFLALNASYHYGLIPVVYGGARYASQLPPGSFIDANAFDTSKDLADYLRNLSSKPDEIKSFFKWQFNFYIDQDENSHVVSGWQALCTHLWDAEVSSSSNESISITVRQLRSRMGKCRFPSP